MTEQRYYSQRKNMSARPQLSLDDLADTIRSIHSQFDANNYFMFGLGYTCDREGHVGGFVGRDPDTYLFRKTGKRGLWPPKPNTHYEEDDLFDLVEFLHDCGGKPTRVWGCDANFGKCVDHCTEFDVDAGRQELRKEVNEVLALYSTGFELSADGEVLASIASEMSPLVEDDLPETDPENVEDRIRAAILKYRHRRAPVEQRREAVRGLVDVLEFLRPQAKENLQGKDESDLFNIANNFALRHHNSNQKSAYDPEIWLDWMFFFYLSTLRALLRLMDRREGSQDNP